MGRVGEVLTGCDGIYLEFNHDPHMVQASEYPPRLKQRILSDDGHLSNAQASELLGRLAGPRLAHVWLAHLSAVNNRPELASEAARRALGRHGERVVLTSRRRIDRAQRSI